MAAQIESPNEYPRPRLRRWLWGGAGLLLLTPLVAMQFSDEVQWTAFDFAVMGATLAAVCGAFELAIRARASTAYRAGAALAVAGNALLQWINLAVGIIGSENNPANLMFLAVPAVGLLGALIGRFRPTGLKRTLIAMAVTQAGIGFVTLAAGLGMILPLTAVFTGLWLAAAWLFWRAAREG